MDKEWEKISAWNLTKVRSKKEVIDQARNKGAKVHFASLMDICHLKNAELEAKHQKYKGRAVLRICETSQIYYLMGRRPMKDVLGNHLKDRSFHVVHWLSITL